MRATKHNGSWLVDGSQIAGEGFKSLDALAELIADHDVRLRRMQRAGLRYEAIRLAMVEDELRWERERVAARAAARTARAKRKADTAYQAMLVLAGRR